MLHILTRIRIIDACSITQTEFDMAHQVIRGTAHLIEFAVLGVLSYLFFDEISGSRAFRSEVVSFVFCVLYAISDEIHQYFVPGRSADLNDILIDAAGAGLGIVVTWTILRYLRRRKNMNTAEKL
jgi:VanZ family protein